MRVEGSTVIIDNFIDNLDRVSGWTLKITQGNVPNTMIIALHWGQKPLATHRVVVTRSELLKSLLIAFQASLGGYEQ